MGRVRRQVRSLIVCSEAKEDLGKVFRECVQQYLAKQARAQVKERAVHIRNDILLGNDS